MIFIKSHLIYGLILVGELGAWAQNQPAGNPHPNPDKSLVVTFDEIKEGLDKISKSSTPTPDDLRTLYKECMYAPEGQNTENWNSYRRLKLSLLLQFYAMTDKLLDPKFNPHDPKCLAFINPPTPPGSDLIPGQDPSQVKDPQQRAAYQTLIDENNAKMKYVNLQGTLINVRNRCLKYTKFYIKGHYNDLEMAEVKQLLSEYLGSDSAVQTLLSSQ